MTIPSFPHQSATLLKYPFDSPYESEIELTNPEFNNAERLSLTRIFRETKGGDLEVFADEIWPKDNELAWTFNNLTEAQKTSLEDFLVLSLGKDIRIIDHEGLTWKGIITNPESEFVQDGKDSCGLGRYTISLTFNVELISWL